MPEDQRTAFSSFDTIGSNFILKKGNGMFRLWDVSSDSFNDSALPVAAVPTVVSVAVVRIVAVLPLVMNFWSDQFVVHGLDAIHSFVAK